MMSSIFTLKKQGSFSIVATKAFNFKSNSSKGGLLLGIVLSVLFVSCSKQNNDVLNTDLIEAAKMKKIIVDDLGVNENLIIEDAEKFVVDGDMVFMKKNFFIDYDYKTKTANTQAKHYKYPGLVTTPQIISVVIDKKLSLAWQNAAKAAFVAWNNLGLKVKFSAVVGSYCPVGGITVTSANLGTANKNVTAQSVVGPLAGGVPGNVITINTGCATTLTAAGMQNCIMHETGHSISLSHTSMPNSQVSQIITSISSCNTGTDPFSIMNSSNTATTYFTTCDVAALKIYK